MEQIGGHILTNASTDEFNGAVEGLTLAVITHHVEVAGASGLLEVEAEMACFILNRVEFQTRLAHVPTNGSVTAGIHHQVLDWSVGTEAQVHPAVAHLHRTGQHQSSGHGSSEHHAGEERQTMALPRLTHDVGC